MKLLRSARFDAAALAEIARGRAFGVPTFVVGALLLPLFASIYRLATGYTWDDWVTATIVGVVGAIIGVTISWFLLRGTAMASSRIRLSVREPLKELWTSVGNCGNPPRDHSRRFAIVGITLTVGVWIVVPTLVGLSFLRSLDLALERVAAVGPRALDAADEPRPALVGRAVRPRLRRHAALGALLDPVVADRGRGVERLVDVLTGEVLDEARVERATDPEARVAVGLELDAHLPTLRAGVAVGAAQHAGEVLDVMAVLVREHVRLGQRAALGAEL